jgi:endoglycosylceramidase
MWMRALGVVVVGAALIAIGAMAQADDYLTVQGSRLVDGVGRHVLLRGLNIGFSCRSGDGATAEISWEHGGPEVFAQIKQWGFNCVRVPIYWAAIEPECGTYDEEFLTQVDEKIAWAKEGDLYVILDMHQEMWGIGVPGGSGAPAWALLDKKKPHKKEGPLWVTSFQSLRIRSAFDSFWKNAPGPDGTGLQDRFALAWRHVAERYADEPTVAGYDLFNDPSPGGTAYVFMMTMLSSVSPRITAKGESLDGLSMNEKGARCFDEAYTDPDSYRAWMDGASGVLKKFESQTLGPMYDRVAARIREIDKRHLLFTSSSSLANLGTQGGMPPLAGPGGKPDPLQVYAPHIYEFGAERAALITERLLAMGKQLGKPIFIGEWGNLSNQDEMHPESPAPAGAVVGKALGKALASHAYCRYEKGMEQAAYFKKLLQRPYPLASAGTTLRHSFDQATRVFECIWREEVGADAPTLIYVPAEHYAGGHAYKVAPTSECTFEPLGETGGGYLMIAPTGKTGERTLTLRPKG